MTKLEFAISYVIFSLMTVTTQLAKILVRSYDDAKMAHHEFLTPEHLLRAALEFPQVCDLLNICGGDIESIRSTLNDYINNQIPVLKDAKGKNNKEDTAPVETHSYQEIMNRAIYHCVSSEKDFVDITDVLVSMLDETKNYCSYSLRAGGIDRQHLLEAISYINGTELSGDNTVNIGDVKKADETKVKTEPGSVKTQEFPGTGRKNILERYTVNLTSLAKEGKLEDIVGRQDELNRIIQILCRKSKNNPLYVGDPGVGKTALTDGLAIRIANGEVPDSLKEAQIFSLNISSLIAGTKFRGDFEERINKIVEELSKYNSPILFIDEIHAIVGSGNSGNGSMDAANILKPIFTSGKIRFIGTTTFEAYKKSFEKDRALIRRFQKIDIIEPDAAQTLKILKGLCKNYEEFHKVRYSEKALKTAVELSVKYLPERRLPDKAIDIIDEAGSFTRIYKSGGKAAHTGDTAHTDNSAPLEKSSHTDNAAYIP
ncbi:MAG: ATP-dependent Clp protease ATP-binding subunit, partial [Treponema sp.]|nr:ATP-dependent Clp protease ATP-binding subunit [Treponema sp.]